MPRSFVCSASLKRDMAAAMVGAAVTGRRPLRRLFTKEQRAFFDAHAGDMELDELTVLGPVSVLKQEIAPVGFGRYLTVELWLYPDALPNLELSTKCRPSQALRVAAETRRFLGKHGIDLSEEQETKTRKTLGFFSPETNPGARQRGWARYDVTQ